MSVNVGTKARAKFGSLIVGGDVSDGGKGVISTSGTPAVIYSIRQFTSSLVTFPALTGGGATGASTQSVTLTGAKLGDIIIATPLTALQNALSYSATVTSANTVGITVTNSGSGTLIPNAGTWSLLWIQLINP